ncbi:hypothetical protein [Parabacteroides sp. FAFU027]|uniref:hypothetical protein n=1 Tax=Parabacteroides sp. FAFU027 TaxID=2922715 RepID=UPI001FAFFFFF|nr:hypothetical protein [Parabacteroides sp. FAFU027]
MSHWKDYETTPTYELVELIKKRKEPSHESISRAAFQSFVFRFSNDLTQKTEIICKSWKLSAEEASIIANRTFKKFWKHASFSEAKAKHINPDKAILFYLYGIAHNELVDYHNEKNGINIYPYDGSEEIVWDFPEIECDQENMGFSITNEHYKIVKFALSKLTEKHKIIFLTYSTYERNGRKLPRHLLQKLRTELGLTQDTIRYYKNEVFNKVTECLELNELNKKTK